MGLTDYLFGSNEVGDLLKKYSTELEGMGPSALSQLERQNLLAGRKRNIMERFKTRSARGTASLARRGVKSPGILSNFLAKLGTQAAGDVSQAESDILMKSLSMGRQEKSQLQRLIALLSQAQDAKGGFIPGLLETGAKGLGAYLGAG